MIKFTREQTLSILEQFVKNNNNNRMIRSKDLGSKNHLPSYRTIVALFGSFSNCVYHLELKMNVNIKENLKIELQEAANILGHTPKAREMKELGFSDSNTFIRTFGSWNEALKYCGLSVNKVIHDHTDLVCFECGATTTTKWYHKNDNTICNKCYQSERFYVRGILDPNSCTGQGVIFEEVANRVLNGIGDKCLKLNTIENFHSKFDLQSSLLGTLDVKSSRLCKNSTNSHYWHFRIGASSAIPDNYFCMCINDNDEIEHVFVIPGNSPFVKTSIHITNSERCIINFKQFELDAKPFNDEYQKIKSNLTSIFEFRNLGVVQ